MSKKIHEGDLEIKKGDTTDYSELEEVTGYLSIYSSADLKAPALKSIGGDLHIYSKISNDLEKRLWGANRKKGKNWTICEQQSNWLIDRLKIYKKAKFRIGNVEFPYELFRSVRDGKLSAKEVFEIENTEQRRVAYERMDKVKMKDLPNLKTLDERKDNYGNSEKIISFTSEKYDTPFYFFNCFCPSTKREYFLETREQTCEKAKAKSFGFEEISFVKEW